MSINIPLEVKRFKNFSIVVTCVSLFFTILSDKTWRTMKFFVIRCAPYWVAQKIGKNVTHTQRSINWKFIPTWRTWLCCTRKFGSLLWRARLVIESPSSPSSFRVLAKTWPRYTRPTLIENKCVSGVWSKNIVRRCFNNTVNTLELVVNTNIFHANTDSCKLISFYYFDLSCLKDLPVLLSM